ncbi:MAG TPA: H-X9-DG-CTERM domain-containing protein [Chthoniobacteraceae bacterium]|nr:H-X9-DG-CTERM domain-containing protein [Chthoniobacteraceae bacterium]
MKRLPTSPPTRPVRSLDRRGFTLPELLLLLVLIGILALLLYAAVGKARESSENTRCVSNLKTLGIAIHAYAADFNGALLPRTLGLYRPDGDKPPDTERMWTSRLFGLGYVSNADVFYCPSFFPRNAGQARYKIVNDLGKLGTAGADTYGMRVWVPPGTPIWKMPIREEHKPLSRIERPSEFFLLADSLWTHPAYRSQGYGLSPGLDKEQFIHLRHSGKANALFADGHVAATARDYFETVNDPGRQRDYCGGENLKFGVTDEMEPW